VCSILTVPVAVALIAQPFSVPFYAGVILVLQGVAWFGGRRLAVASA
jgi:hypothetical protein